MLIQATRLNKHFGAKHVLKDVSFDIEAGSPIALVGPNGAGKTTLFSILCGYLSADSGSLHFGNDKASTAKRLKNLAALPQDAQLDPSFSLFKQFSFYGQLQGLTAQAARLEAMRVLELVNLQDVSKEYPQHLSHGMRKRACIAQALIGDPQLVLLDEATAGLDPKHAKEIRELVASLSDDITFILSSHDLSELERLCQRVYYLDQGVLSLYDTKGNAADRQHYTLRLKQRAVNFESLLQLAFPTCQVTQTQDREYTIEIGSSHQQFDVALLMFLYQHNLPYHQLTNGMTLENQLFSNKYD
ncbi:ABC transporter ATP-binding protein [Pseudoalteromonas fenneropenaei]|uniref:ABC transporter ATP-binding protein n=1 Tax=Pseudoalteromonas fenneropenaei TaxID=1737459 RepID=A0ABV7CJP9_9GAMM